MPREQKKKNVGGKEALVRKISRDRKKFVKNLEGWIDNHDNKKEDIWSFLLPAKKQKTISDIFLHLPKDQQVNILISYLSESRNVGTLIPNVKASVLRDIVSNSAQSSVVSVPSGQRGQGQKKQQGRQRKQKKEVYQTLEGGKTLGNLGDLNTFFFNGKDHGHADATQNSFMEGFLRAHHNEKNGIKPKSVSRRKRDVSSIIRLTANKSVPGISFSILSPPAASTSKGLLDQYMISNKSDFKTWKSIVASAAPKKLIEDIERLVSIGNFPQEASYRGRLESLAKTAFVKPPPINSKNVSEKCIVLENEMKIAQKDMASSFEFCLTVYVLYKLLNLNAPRVKIL